MILSGQIMARQGKLKTSATTGNSPSGRLDTQTWVNAALRVLADRGIANVRIESLARDLGVTKGSFYWHFKNRDALLRDMLGYWRRRTTLYVMDRIEQRASSPKERIEKLLELPFASERAPEWSDVELAIRLWGRKDAMARETLSEVDELRLHHMISIFRELGFDGVDAEARATLCYAYMRVAATLPTSAAREQLLRATCDTLTARAGEFSN